MRPIHVLLCASWLVGATGCAPVQLAPASLSPNPIMLGAPRDIHGKLLKPQGEQSTYRLETSVVASSTSSTQQQGNYEVTTTTSSWAYQSSDPDTVVLAQSGGRPDAVFTHRPRCSAWVLLSIGGGVGAKGCSVEGQSYRSAQGAAR